MKLLAIAWAVFLGLPFSGYGQGIDCATAINIPLDAALRSYVSSSATGGNVLCTSNGTTPVTWFRFTSSSTGQCPLLNITAADSAAIEVAFYTSCGSMLASSSMCFYNGYGLWAPNENFVTSPGTVYYLRVKTSSACTIRIAGQHYTPPNDNCLGALTVDAATLLNDNNACDHGEPGLPPSQLCALTLENTAWYQFYVASTGYSIITISNIHCDNGAANNNSGFQIGFFTGTCNALEWINCNNGSGSTVQATTTLLQAGTRVFVAIDGISGANCSYSINGLNITGVLASTVKNFSGWKASASNILQWTTSNEAGGHYIAERSLNAVNFTAIGRVTSIVRGRPQEHYSLEDRDPAHSSFYRLRHIDLQGKATLSDVIAINREALPGLQVTFLNPVHDQLDMRIRTQNAGVVNFKILNMQGQVLLSGSRKILPGTTPLSQTLQGLPAGQYALILEDAHGRINKLFFKN